MKKTTKILSMLLVAVMFVSLMGTSAFAYELVGEGTTGSAGVSSSGSFDSVGSGSSDYEMIGSGSDANGVTAASGTAGDYEILDGAGDEVLGSGTTVQLRGALDVAKPFYVGSETNTFATLAAAATAAGTGGTVYLGVSGVTLSVTDADNTISNNVTLNLKGFTLTTSAAPITVDGAATVTITNGTFTGGNYIASVGAAASLVLSNVTALTSGLHIDAGGKVSILSGTYGDGVAQSGVTITAGTFKTSDNPVDDDHAAKAAGTAVSGSAGNWVVSSDSTAGKAARIGSSYYNTFDVAYDNARAGETIQLLLPQDTAKTTIDKNLTLALGTNMLTLTGGDLTIATGAAVNVTGGEIAGADIVISSGASLNLNSGNPVIQNVTNNGTLNVASGAGTGAQVGAVTGAGTTSIHNGTVASLVIDYNSALYMDGGSTVLSSLEILDFTTVKVNVSGGTITSAAINLSSAAASRSVTGGVWGGIDDDDELSALKEYLVPATSYGITKVDATTYKVGAGAGSTTGGTGGTGTTGDFSAAASRSDPYVYNPNVSQSSVTYPYYVTLPTGGTLNSVSFITASGTYTAGVSSLAAGTVYLTRDSMAALPAGTATVRFNFSGGSVDVNTLYVLPSFGISASGTTPSFTLYDANGINDYSVRVGNVSSASAARTLGSSDYYLTGSGGDLRLTLTPTGISNINTGSGNTYNVWYYLSPYAFNMGSFTMNSNGQVTGSTTNSGTGDPYNSTSSGILYVAPSAGSTWASGDGDMPFITNSAYTLKSVSIDDGLPLGVLRWRDYGNGYFDLDDGMLATLSRGVHKVTVTNTNGESGSCTFYIGPSLVPKDTTKHTTGSGLNLRYVCSDPIYEVYVNTVWLDPAYYGLSNDRRTLTIYADFLNARTAGQTYPLSVDIDNDGIGKNAGDADAFSSFTILTTAQAAASPRTGDDGNIALWAALLGISGVAALVMVPQLKRRED